VKQKVARSVAAANKSPTNGAREELALAQAGAANIRGSASVVIPDSPYIVWFDAASQTDFPRLGGKCASLATLTAANLPVPFGFAVVTDAYAEMLDTDGLGSEIAERLAPHDTNDVAGQARIAREIQEAIVRRPIPNDIAEAVRSAYRELSRRFGHQLPVAARSSGTVEDTPEASFAGQGDTYLWVVGEDAVLDRVKACWASLFNARAIAYRAQHGLDDLQGLMAVAVQQMVDAKASGVAMTLDPSNGDRSKIVIEASWGLGELIVSGEVTPDHFLIDKIMLETVKRTIGAKTHELVVDPAAQKTLRREVDADRQLQPSLTDVQLKAVAAFAKAMERHFGCPQDIEWAIDAARTTDSGVVILQSRPETVWSRKLAATVPIKTYAVGVDGVLNTLLTPVVVKKP
jgi:pyruvate, water dikinase